MKIAHKVGIAASIILSLAICLLSWNQYMEVRDTLRQNSDSSIEEASGTLAHQISNWLNGKLALIDMMAESIDGDFSAEQIQQVFDLPMLKSEFILIFGGLDTDGQRITNDPSWNPANWDARKRPWYPVARASKRAALTEPYADAASGEILISVVANLTDKGEFRGAFGGDLSLQSVSEALNTLNFGGAGYAFLLTRSGNIISHPEADLNGKQISELFDGQSPALDQKPRELQLSDRNLFVSFTPLTDLKGMDWYIGVVVDSDQVMAEASSIGWRALIGVIVSVLISLMLLGLLMKQILKPLSQLNDSLVDINQGEGDLTRRIPVTGEDEFGRVATEFNGFVEHLQTLITDVKGLSEDIRHSSQLTYEEAENSSSRLQEQLTELDQLASAMQEMSASATEVASHAQGAAAAALQADKQTAEGAGAVARTSESIARLASDMEQAVETINELARFSTSIESILQVITGIAEQTNLLALNAAIEAARAGESGRGFAVVADEVRSLASRTQQSTSEIREMIDQLQSGVNDAEQKILESRDQATVTAEEATRANEMLDQIRSSIAEINNMNLQIATAAEEQSATSEEINRNTTNIRDISRLVSDGAGQQVQNCSEVARQLDQQNSSLSQFKI